MSVRWVLRLPDSENDLEHSLPVYKGGEGDFLKMASRQKMASPQKWLLPSKKNLFKKSHPPCSLLNAFMPFRSYQKICCAL